MHGPELNEIKFGDQIEAWQRQLPHLPCPLKFEAGCLFKRQPNGDWFEAVDVSWMARWWGVECDARGAPGDRAYGIHPELWSDLNPNPLARMPSMGAVTFLGLVDGKNACRPATDDELRRPETDELFREIWCSEPETDPPSGRAWVRDKRNGFYGTIPVENLASATEGLDAEYTKCDCVATERVKDP